MVLLNLENVMTDVLPGVPLPAGAASFVIARVQWIREGEVGVFDVEAPSPWNCEDLCTLALLVSNHETTLARLMIANLLSPPSILLPSSTLVNRNDNFLRQNPFRRRPKKCQSALQSAGHDPSMSGVVVQPDQSRIRRPPQLSTPTKTHPVR